MRRSPAVAAALREYFASRSAGDSASYRAVVADPTDVLLIGSEAREWFAGEQALQSLGLDGITVDPGVIDAWEHGEIGWAVCQPVFALAEGPAPRLRFTGVFLRVEASWRLIHGHASYPVPDEVAVEHPEYWDSAQSEPPA